MTRAFRQQIDEGILDHAAGLFARHGYPLTSIRAVADAVGLSKPGLLHRFPSKEALREAVVRRSQELQRDVYSQVHDMPPGPERDRAVIETVVDQAQAHPGLLSLTLGFHTLLETDARDAPGGDTRILIEAFGSGPEPEPERLLRITAAFSAVSMLVLAAHRAGKPSAWRPHIVAIACDSFGHPHP
ncbi:TetR/AcrR family transcriptional regulator [Actinocorallia herbida]|uniref:TetR/AcrR family transcriptional regulator n=1 Tax=Actinocorallia herbida TaxID=58109 RepID=UPI000F4D1CE7|nr:TetR/AcrR family transcriptional regulator [Actinocorallia herbida]